MSAVVSYGRSLVTTNAVRSAPRLAIPTVIRADWGARRSATERRVDPRPATVPAPQPSVGDTRVSRWVSGHETPPRDGEEGCRGGFWAAEAQIRECRMGERSSVMGEAPTGRSPAVTNDQPALPRSDTGATPARQRRAPARNESRAARRVSGGEGFQVAFPSQAGAWRSPRQRLPSRPPMRNNPSEKVSADLRSHVATFGRLHPAT